MEKKVAMLKRILEESKYTVALWGSGMLEEAGRRSIKHQERAYEIEKKYHDSPEDLFSSVYYSTRPEKFFEFYKNEILGDIPSPTSSGSALAAMEKAGKLQCVITSNIYDQPRRAGCSHVINLRGSVYKNRCTRCEKEYPVEYILDAKGIPFCENCKGAIRPQVSLFGEMVDARLMRDTTLEVERAEVLLVLGATLQSEVFANYIRYFNGKYLVVIHQRPHHSDDTADLVIIDEPKNVLGQLGYE
ncbi:MAG: Sir2 family NAD-dependent protein deacetylase [Lachnospiraceae bacterium]|nr:NAD-dependent deacetylase [Robinsoniella sp.]MDY3766088.1 Sir2 family NAD-dependent protein deacetylase [Lachnospiraceae bacterium]